MRESKVKEKLQKDTEKYQEDNNSLPAILESWKKIYPTYFANVVLNTEGPISSKILTSFGIKVHNDIFVKYIGSKTSVNNYFNYLESININRMSFALLNESKNIIYNSIENKEVTDTLKEKAYRLSFIINSRIEKVKTYNLTTISIGDHEHDNVRDFSFYCSEEKDLKNLFKLGQIKIDRSFEEFVRDEDDGNQEISYFISKLSKFVLAETSHIEDDSPLINLAYIYLEIANLGGPVDYCYANGANCVSLRRNQY